MSNREEPNSPSPKIPRSDTVKISAAGRKADKRQGGFPVADWDRYEFVRFLGEGGMGRVYKARDPKLNRYVALKFIRGDDPELLERFFREAQAQARIDHKNVCKVYEVGEVEGRPYIAMQYIEGDSLREAKDEMNLEERLRAMKDVCEGMHEAHRLGLIHRDIKPTNIMVERDGEGQWHPYVMDFGLVREVEAEGQTTTGAVMGTPSYMSPEQALGENRKLDRRSDVYSLGATLYALLAGKPPFQGESGIEVVLKVLKKEPEPLTAIDPAVPADVETITLKCLGKKPQARYESAKALAEDIQRYLDGEPIKARRASWTYWLAKKARKHKAIFATVAFASFAVVVLGGMGVRASLLSAKRAEAAQQFGQEVEKIDSILRYAHMLPLHEVSLEKNLVRIRMKRIEERMAEIGSAAQGPGNFALGRGHLALQEFVEARRRLEKAWELNYRTPEVKYALGQALGVLYQRELEAVNRIEDNQLWAARKKEIERAYRDPSLEYLRGCIGADAESPAFVEGLIAFYDGRYEEALKKSSEAFKQIPWLYEAKKLEGDVYLALGIDKQEKGEQAEALTLYERAAQAYANVMKTAQSDAVGYEAECYRAGQVMHAELIRGGDVRKPFEQALSACDSALQADPESGIAYRRKSQLYRFLSEDQFSRGEDPRSAIDAAIETGLQAVRLIPYDSEAHMQAGNAHLLKARYETEHGADPRASLDQAIENYRSGLQVEQNYAVLYNNIGLAFRQKGEYEISQGGSLLEPLDEAVENHLKAVSLYPSFGVLHANLGIAYSIKGEYESSKGKDPRASLENAIKSYLESVRLDPNDSYTYNNIGSTYISKAEYEASLGASPDESLDRAIENYRKAIEVNPKNFSPYAGLGRTYLLKGEYEAEKGLDSLPLFDLAVGQLRKSIQINPGNAYLYNSLGIVHWTKGQRLLDHNKEPEADLNEGRKSLGEAVRINPNDFEVYLNLGNIELTAAQWRMARNASPNPQFGKAEEMLRRALKLNSQDASVYQAKAKFHLLRAKQKLKLKESVLEDAREASAAIEKALSINPGLAKAVEPLAAEARRLVDP